MVSAGMFLHSALFIKLQTLKINTMKIIIELNEAEVKGIKAYLNEVDNVKADKKYIQQYIQSIVSGNINAPQEAVSDYIKQFSHE